MPIRSMTGFAQVRGEIQRPDSAAVPAGSANSNGRMAFALSLKSVNHRFLDLHFRLPSGTDSLEMQLRRLLKEKMGRGHVEVSLSLERTASESFSINREIVGGYIAAFRAAAAEFSPASEPDLNAVLRIPGALDSANDSADGEIEGCGHGQDRRSPRPPQPDARRRRPRHCPRTARPHGPPGRSQQERAATSPRCAAELQRAAAVALAGTAGCNRRQRARAAGGCITGRPQRYSGRDRPARNSRAAFSGTARSTAARSERSWTSCCRK